MYSILIEPRRDLFVQYYGFFLTKKNIFLANSRTLQAASGGSTSSSSNRRRFASFCIVTAVHLPSEPGGVVRAETRALAGRVDARSTNKLDGWIKPNEPSPGPSPATETESRIPH